MRRLVILGGGTAGTMIANKLRHRLDRTEWSITVVDRDDEHHYQPGYLFLPFGAYSHEQVVRSRRAFLPDGVDFVVGSIDKVEPEANVVLLDDGRGQIHAQTVRCPPCRSSAMSSMLSAPATIPATSEATFNPAFPPLSVGTVRYFPASSWSPADRARARTGTCPADDTRFGSSNTADTAAVLWQSCIYEMPFVTAKTGPHTSPIFPARKGILTSRRTHTTPCSSVDRGSGPILVAGAGKGALAAGPRRVCLIAKS